MITPIICKLTSLNRKQTIYQTLKIKNEARSLDYDFSENYEYKYIFKGKEKIVGKSNLINDFLKTQKDITELLDVIPDGANPDLYRPIINYKKEADWLKKSQRIFYKILANGLEKPSYLHSTFKNTSYASNGREHADGTNRFMFCVDISSFFTRISREKVYKTLKSYLKIDNDVAFYYSKLVTAPIEKESKDLFLAQGLPSSPLLAFLCYKTLFDYIDNLSIEKGIKFTLYVDDMTFSSSKKISQKFIDTILGLIKSSKYDNRLRINKKKIHNCNKSTRKKVTGVYIENGIPKISGKKHFELFVLYTKLIELLHSDMKTIDEYFNFYNYFLKFSGNLIHLYQVEHNGNFKDNCGVMAHEKMKKFYKELSKYIKPRLTKVDKRINYSQDNVELSDLKIANDSFEALKKNLNRLKIMFPKLKRNLLS